MKERFWSKVDMSWHPNGCWEWLGTLGNTGYGRFSIDHKNYSAHRVAYELWNSTILSSDVALMHSCDNTTCVNPGHLSPGTQADNIRDRVAKGRCAKGLRVSGSNNANAKLTADKVVAIRSEYASGTSTKELAGKYGISMNSVQKIFAHQTWKHI